MQGKKGLYLQVTETPLELTLEKRLALKRALLPVIYNERIDEVGFINEYESSCIALEAEDHAKWQAYRKMVDEGGLNAIGGEMGKFKYQGKSERMLPLEELEAVSYTHLCLLEWSKIRIQWMENTFRRDDSFLRLTAGEHFCIFKAGGYNETLETSRNGAGWMYLRSVYRDGRSIGRC